MQTPTPISIDHAKLFDALLPVTLAAARIQMSYFRRKTAVSSKPDASPVTAADQESETLIVTLSTHWRQAFRSLPRRRWRLATSPTSVKQRARNFF